jgi:hypothetical protein
MKSQEKDAKPVKLTGWDERPKVQGKSKNLMGV